MHLIDTHSHLYLEQFAGDIDDVISRAQQAGVKKIILPNIDSTTVAPLNELCLKYPATCIPLLGLHPTHVKENFRDELQLIRLALQTNTYAGIGEIGIDLYWDKSFFDQQKQALELQLDLALENNLPVVIHARDSFREILDIVEKQEYNQVRGIFHAFTGDVDLAKEIINLGYLLGIGGIVTFKNSHLPEVVKEIDLKHLVVETDSPYLAPTPHRGKRNESSYVKLVAQKIAEIKAITFEEVAAVTSKNAETLFGL